LAARVWGLELSSAVGPSSLVASMSVAAELLEGQIDAAATNGVHWGSHSMFLEVEDRAGGARVQA
jgi:hypothetical protein